MATMVGVDSPGGKWTYDFEFEITTSGAIVANSDGTTTTDPDVSVVYAGSGVYTVTIVGNFYKVLSRLCQYWNATPADQWAQITAVGLGTGTATATGEATTTLTIKTLDDTATPSAQEQSSGTIAVHIAFQKNKI